MTMMSDLIQDLLEEILSRVPTTSLRAMRSTCKRWNELSKDPSFSKKHCGKAAEGILVIMLNDFRACSMSVNHHRIHNNKYLVDPSVKEICTWIKPTSNYNLFDKYGLRYDNNSNQKIFRFLNYYDYDTNERMVELEIFDLKCNIWKVLEVVTPEWHRPNNCCGGVSVKGNTYFVAEERRGRRRLSNVLICFDFTKESFGSHLHLPFEYHSQDVVTLSSVRGEKLTMCIKEAFFLDEKKKLAVIYCRDKEQIANFAAYMIGENGNYNEVHVGESTTFWPLVYSYVPSWVQIH
ncbi:hypothetical protein CARUB_v10027987mg [Capsella rubella]|uniref:F-box domain-containing protein n=1 Tax=Capsella rubella TaxID=81985 RepID=R0GDC3_9BRAS|nr:hypothetical protein CARUB_v10027987mg [Capsella rubella]